jgi:hypothetical protein
VTAMGRSRTWQRARPVAGVAAVACVCWLLLSCTLTGANVTLRSPTGVLAMTGEGRFADFAAAARAGKNDVVAHCFSRRFVIEAVLGGTAGAYPPTTEEWLAHLEALDAALAAPEAAPVIAAFFTAVSDAYRSADRRGAIHTSRAKNTGKRHLNDRDEPWGPNRQTVELHSTVHGAPNAADGARLAGAVVAMQELTGTVSLVQEYEEWRIDGISGELGAVLLGEKAIKPLAPAADKGP